MAILTRSRNGQDFSSRIIRRVPRKASTSKVVQKPKLKSSCHINIKSNALTRAGNEIPDSLIKTRIMRLETLRKSKTYHEIQTSSYENKLQEWKSSARNFTDIEPKLKKNPAGMKSKSSRRDCNKSKASNTLTDNECTLKKKFKIKKKVPMQEKRISRSTCNNVNTHYRKDSESKVEETKRKLTNLKSTHQNVCPRFSGKSPHELVKTTCLKKLKMSKSSNLKMTVHSKGDTPNELKEVPFQKKTRIHKLNDQELHTRVEITDNLVEPQFEKNIKIHKSKHMNLSTPTHPSLKVEYPAGFENVPRKNNLKMKNSCRQNIYTISKSETYQYNESLNQVKESEISNLTVTKSIYSDFRSCTKSKYFSYVKSTSETDMKILESIRQSNLFNFHEHQDNVILEPKRVLFEDAFLNDTFGFDGNKEKVTPAPTEPKHIPLEDPSQDNPFSFDENRENVALALTNRKQFPFVDLSKDDPFGFDENEENWTPAFTELSQVAFKNPYQNYSFGFGEHQENITLTNLNQIPFEKTSLREELQTAFKSLVERSRASLTAVNVERQPCSSTLTDQIIENLHEKYIEDLDEVILRSTKKYRKANPNDRENFTIKVSVDNIGLKIAVNFKENDENNGINDENDGKID